MGGLRERDRDRDSDRANTRYSLVPDDLPSFDLHAIAEATVAKLGRVWDDLGVEEVERVRLVGKLCRDVAAIYSGLLRSQEDRKAAAIRDIATMAASIDVLRAEMRADAGDGEDDTTADLTRVADDATLTDPPLAPTVARLSAELRRLRTARRSTVADYRSKLSAVGELWRALDIPLKARDETLANLVIENAAVLAAQAKVGDRRADADDSPLADVPGSLPADDPFAADDTLDVSPAARQRVADVLLTLQDEYDNRSDLIDSLTTQINRLFKLLCEIPRNTSALDGSVVNCEVGKNLGYGTRVVEQLQARLADLTETRERREAAVRDHAKEITRLWNRLNVPQEVRDAFFARHTGLGADVIDSCAVEREKLRVEKAKRMSEIVAAAADRVEELWEEAGIGEEQRAGCTAYSAARAGKVSDEVLEKLEDTATELDKRLVQLRPLLSLVEKRQQLLEEKTAADIAASDPTRLTSRRGGATRLLEEERFRRRFAKQMPALEARIGMLYRKWIAEHPEEPEIVFKGTPLTELIAESVLLSKPKGMTSTVTAPTGGPAKSRYATTALGAGAAGRSGRVAQQQQQQQAKASAGDENGKTAARRTAKYATMPAKAPRVGATLVGHGARRDAPLPRVALLAQAKANKRAADIAR